MKKLPECTSSFICVMVRCRESPLLWHPESLLPNSFGTGPLDVHGENGLYVSPNFSLKCFRVASSWSGVEEKQYIISKGP